MFPQILYKAFPCEEYAKSFVNGNIRFSTLAYYKNMENDERGDRTEGEGQLKRDGEELVVDLENQVIHSKPGIENLNVSASENDRFICCFSSPEDGLIESLPPKFGEYYVVVSNPEILFNDMDNVINNDKGLQQNPPYLESSPVRYDKGHYVGEISDRDEIRMLAWMQKPENYLDEQEYRFQFWFSSSELIGSPEHYHLNLERRLEYCEIVQRKS